ncbi:SseB family protein [Zhihengliuella halotolerans]|uniref:Type III secretion system (T3SS) SseB-like protein n=1 Tax=Zhihengliuella halotolerans TaxID=370736 RepID=A0A4Q8AE57_9MICC|nr:SseB family protein [Zhihengliuella halotolerans]RZU61849.1 type III secretion system (T3SS) SseB-like protein [Zhihengliuella halotolerans]
MTHDDAADRPQPASPEAHGSGAGGARDLPGHIAAALQRAGGAADSAGQSWEGRDLSGEGNPLHDFDQDDGLADPGFTAALDRLRRKSGSEEDVVAALATARVFVPVVAALAEGGLGEHGFTEDKEADMALVTIKAPDGRSALPIFTSVAALQGWHPEARPVAVYAPRAALSAVQEDSQLLVVDPGAETTFVVRRPAMWALAQQRPWTPSYRDESLVELLRELSVGEPIVRRLALSAGSGVACRDRAGGVVPGGGHGPELRLTITFARETDPAQAQAAVGRLQKTLSTTKEFAEAVDSLEMRLASEA